MGGHCILKVRLASKTPSLLSIRTPSSTEKNRTTRWRNHNWSQTHLTLLINYKSWYQLWSNHLILFSWSSSTNLKIPEINNTNNHHNRKLNPQTYINRIPTLETVEINLKSIVPASVARMENSQRSQYIYIYNLLGNKPQANFTNHYPIISGIQKQQFKRTSHPKIITSS